jgi:hypothetical protein
VLLLAGEFALLEVVEPDCKQAGHKFQEGVPFAVLSLAGVGGDGLGSDGRQLTVFADFVLGGFGEAFLLFEVRPVGGIGFPVHDEA